MSVVRRRLQGSPVSFKQQPKSETAPSSTPYRICSGRKKATQVLSKPTRHRAKRSEAAYQLPSSRTSETEMMTLLEDTGQPCNGCMHKLIAANRLTTMEKELNEAAAKGFRLLWRTAVWKSGAGIAGEASGKVPRVPGAITLKSL